MKIFRFCIHRVHDGGEAQVVLEDARVLFRDAIATHFREAGRVSRWGGAEDVANAAIDEVVEYLDDIAKDATVRL